MSLRPSIKALVGFIPNPDSAQLGGAKKSDSAKAALAAASSGVDIGDDFVGKAAVVDDVPLDRAASSDDLLKEIEGRIKAHAAASQLTHTDVEHVIAEKDWRTMRRTIMETRLGIGQGVKSRLSPQRSEGVHSISGRTGPLPKLAPVPQAKTRSRHGQVFIASQEGTDGVSRQAHSLMGQTSQLAESSFQDVRKEQPTFAWKDLRWGLGEGRRAVDSF